MRVEDARCMVVRLRWVRRVEEERKSKVLVRDRRMGLAWNASNVMAGMRAWLRLECGLIVFLCCFFLSNKRGITLRVTATTCPPTYPHLPTWLFTYLPTNPPMYLSIQLRTYLSIHLRTSLPTHLRTSLPTHLPVNLPTHPPTCPSTYLSTNRPTYIHTNW